MLESNNIEYLMLSPPDLKRGWQRMPAVILGATCLIGMMCAATWRFIPHKAQLKNLGKVNEKTNMHAIMSAMSRAQHVSKLDLKPMPPGSLAGSQPPPLGYITNVIGAPTLKDKCNPLGFAPDGALGSEEKLRLIGGFKWHPVEQTLYYAAENMVRKIDPETGKIVTLAGHGDTCDGMTSAAFCPVPVPESCLNMGDGGDAFAANFFSVHGLEFNFDTGGIYIVDSWNSVVRYVDPETNIITSVVGQIGKYGFAGDGGPATEATLFYPHGIERDQTTGDLYIPDMQNGAVRKVDGNTGIISSLYQFPGAQPDRLQLVPRTQGGLDIYVADFNGFVYKLDSITGNQTLLAGKYLSSQTVTKSTSLSANGDGGPALEAELSGVSGAQYDITTGDLYISEWTRFTVRKVDGKTGIITTIAGTHLKNASDNSQWGDDGPGKDAFFTGPSDMRWVPERRWLFINDDMAGSVRLMQL